MALVNESWHSWMSHGTCKWVMALVNESLHSHTMTRPPNLIFGWLLNSRDMPHFCVTIFSIRVPRDSSVTLLHCVVAMYCCIVLLQCVVAVCCCIASLQCVVAVFCCSALQRVLGTKSSFFLSFCRSKSLTKLHRGLQKPSWIIPPYHHSIEFVKWAITAIHTATHTAGTGRLQVSTATQCNNTVQQHSATTHWHCNNTLQQHIAATHCSTLVPCDTLCVSVSIKPVCVCVYKACACLWL